MPKFRFVIEIEARDRDSAINCAEKALSNGKIAEISKISKVRGKRAKWTVLFKGRTIPTMRQNFTSKKAAIRDANLQHLYRRLCGESSEVSDFTVVRI